MASEEKKEKGIKPRASRAMTPFDEMDRMFENFFTPRGWMRPLRWDWPALSESVFEGRAPKVDVIDRDREIVVKAELPGVEKKDIEVSLSDNSLTIRATTKHEEKEEKGDYFRRELSQGEFVRTITLPTDVDAERTMAQFKDGLLELTLQKSEGSKRRNIHIE